MASQVKFRGGTTSQHSSFTGAEREVTVDTTLKTLRVHDGLTAGGFRLAKYSELFSGSYDDLANKPSLFSGAYNDLSGKPSLFSGSYNDLTNKPSLFSGSYLDLSNKPFIPSDLGDLTNTPGYLTGSDLPAAGVGTGGNTDQIFHLSDAVATTNYSIPVGKNALVAGPLEIQAGVEITVPANSHLLIL
jgi:hypothetical protein